MTWRLQIPFSGGRPRLLSASELRGAAAPSRRPAFSGPTGLFVSSCETTAPASAGAFSNSQIGARRGVSLPAVDVFVSPLARVGSDKDAPPFPTVLSRSSLPTSRASTSWAEFAAVLMMEDRRD